MIIKLGKPNKPYLTLPSCLTRPHQYKCLIPSVLMIIKLGKPKDTPIVLQGSFIQLLSRLIMFENI